MSRRTPLFVALSFALPAQAQLIDVYGRSIGEETQLAPLAATLPARPAVPRGGAFTLQPYENRLTGSWADTVAIGDVSGDARADVVLATAQYFSPASDYHTFVFPQTVAGTLASPGKMPYHRTPARTGIALGNFNGEGPLDIAIGTNSGTTLHYGTAASPWLRLGGFVGTQVAMSVATIDLDGIGRDDFVTLSVDTGGMRYIADRFGGYSALPWPVAVAGWNSLAKGDLDGDGIDDLAVATQQGALPNLHLVRNNHDGSLSGIGSLDAACGGWRARSLGIGDVDGDGINDIVAAGGGNSPSACLLVFRGSGGGQFAAPQTLTSYDIPETLAVADMNLDGRDDVVVLHGGWMKLGVYLQDAGGALAPERLFDIPYASHYNAQGLAIGDFSSDGCPDVAIADYNSGLVTLRGSRCDTLFADGFE